MEPDKRRIGASVLMEPDKRGMGASVLMEPDKAGNRSIDSDEA